MSDRRKKAASKNKIVAYSAAIIIHALIIGAMVFNFATKPKVVEAFDAEEIDVVKATTIDESQIKHQQKLIKEKDAQKKREELSKKKRLEDLKKQAEQEKQRIADLKEQQKNEQEKTTELEKQRKAIALKAKQEKEKSEKDKAQREKERLEAEKKLAEKKKRDEQARKKREEQAAEKKRIKAQEELKQEQARIEQQKQEQAVQNRFAQQLAAEEARQRTATLTSKYAALVIQAINDKRTIAPDFDASLAAKLNIKLSPRGDVLNVSIVESSGNARYDRDAEKAVRNASPLPIPSTEEDEAAHKTFQDVTLNIKMPNA